MGVSTGIRVDLTALTGVLTDLRRDVDQGLQPSTSGASGDLGDTAKFGDRAVSGEVIAGATDISYAASIAANNIGVHVGNALGLADLMQAAVMSYQLADTLSSNKFAPFEPAVAPTSLALTPASIDADGLTGRFVGPLLNAKFPNQALTAAPHCTQWASYDTPRMWSMVSDEVSVAAWAQMQAFQKLAQAFDEQQRRMLVLRGRLSDAWDAQSAESTLEAWDRHINALASDAACVHATSMALEGILTVLANTRKKMQRQKDTWNNITQDFMLEAWDHKAAETDEESRRIMAEADSAIRDYRHMIKVPDQALRLDIDKVEHLIDEPGSERQKSTSGSSTSNHGAESEGEDSNVSASSQSTRPGNGRVPPPLPGTPIADGPGLSGSSVVVPVAQENPPSILPIAPGAVAQLPQGGAYMLPGPWSSVGRILPMPTPEGTSLGRLGPTSGSGSPAGTGMYGVPSGGYASKNSAHENRQRMGTEQWEVAKGGPTIIGTAQPWYKAEDEGEHDDVVERLEQWIKVVGMPWDLEKGDGDAS